MSVLRIIRKFQPKTNIMCDIKGDLLFFGGFCERKIEKGCVERIMSESGLTFKDIYDAFEQEDYESLLSFTFAVRDFYFDHIDRFTELRKCDKLFLERMAEPGFAPLDEYKKQRVKLIKENLIKKRR